MSQAKELAMVLEESKKEYEVATILLKSSFLRSQNSSSSKSLSERRRFSMMYANPDFYLRSCENA